MGLKDTLYIHTSTLSTSKQLGIMTFSPLFPIWGWISKGSRRTGQRLYSVVATKEDIGALNWRGRFRSRLGVLKIVLVQPIKRRGWWVCCCRHLISQKQCSYLLCHNNSYIKMSQRAVSRFFSTKKGDFSRRWVDTWTRNIRPLHSFSNSVLSMGAP